MGLIKMILGIIGGIVGLVLGLIGAVLGLVFGLLGAGLGLVLAVIVTVGVVLALPLLLILGLIF